MTLEEIGKQGRNEKNWNVSDWLQMMDVPIKINRNVVSLSLCFMIGNMGNRFKEKRIDKNLKEN